MLLRFLVETLDIPADSRPQIPVILGHRLRGKFRIMQETVFQLAEKLLTDFAFLEKNIMFAEKIQNMIGYSYTRKPLSGNRSKQIAKAHPQPKVPSSSSQTTKMPEKFSVPWK